MSKLLYFNIPSTGHVNPTLPVIRELVSRGHEVVYVNTESHRAAIEATGAKFIPYPESDFMESYMDESAGRGDIVRNMYDLVRLSEKLYPYCREIIRLENPDGLIHDSLASWGMLAGKQAGIPRVAFFTTFVLTAKTYRPKLRMALDLLVKYCLVIPEYLLFSARMRARQGIFPASLPVAGMSTGDLNIVFTSREFQPSGLLFSEDYKFVGPTVQHRKEHADFDYSSLNKRPLVYISLGTLARNPGFFRTCFKAFGQEDGLFILSVGKQTEISELGAVPGNFIVRQSVPQLGILQRADIFVTHGGLNSVHESLMHGVPMIAIPQQPEQAVVAVEMERHGAGIALQTSPPYGTVDAESLRKALKTILSSPDYRKRAHSLGNSLDRSGGVEAAVEHIAGYLGERRSAAA